MARPSSPDPKDALTIRLRRSTLARLRQEAGPEGVRSWLAAHLESTFAAPAAEPPPDRDCPHPREEARRLSWGTMCGLCGDRVR